MHEIVPFPMRTLVQVPPFILTKPDCGKCDTLKRLAKEQNIILPALIDASTAYGMAVASYNEALKLPMPTMITEEGAAVSGVIGILRELRR